MSFSNLRVLFALLRYATVLNNWFNRLWIISREFETRSCSIYEVHRRI